MDLRPSPNELLYVTFNQDESCFACGTRTGFRIYNCDPFKETFCREFVCEGIHRVEMLFRCNVLALVGNGKNSRFADNRVIIWDDSQNRGIGELTFKSQVRAVKLRRDKIAVVFDDKIYVYNFADLKLVDHFETTPNPTGICALCPHNTASVLACPGLQQGHIRVELFDRKKSHIIAAHNGHLSCLALNHDGTIVASASEKGTIIRLFDTHTGTALREFRRGSSEARIYHIAFSHHSEFFAVSSNKGTIHIFQIKSSGDSEVDSGVHADEESKHPSGIGASSIKFVKNLVPSSAKNLIPAAKYFSSEFSFSKFSVPEDVKHLVAFGSEKNALYVVGSDGCFYKAVFDVDKGGAAIQESCSRFVKEDS
jgi:WD repeat-containing protein 45